MPVSRETHPCPVPGCIEQVKPGWLMCPGDWKRVPEPLRDAVWHWWRQLNGTSPTARRATLPEYRQAVDAAMVAAAARRGPPCGPNGVRAS